MYFSYIAYTLYNTLAAHALAPLTLDSADDEYHVIA